MNKTILILIIFSNNLMATWLEKYYGISNISSIEIYKYERIKCEYDWKTIYCKTILGNDDINLIEKAEITISEQVQDYFTERNAYCGFMIINSSKVIRFINSFRYPCTKNDTAVQIVGKIHERIKYLKVHELCSMLNKLEWKEIAQAEYDARRNLKVYTKPNFKSIDTVFSKKRKYKIIKPIGGYGDCEKGKYQKRIK